MTEIALGILILLTAFALSFRLAPVFASRAQRQGFLDAPGGRKEQEVAIPYGGGTAVVVALAATIVLGLVLAGLAALKIELVESHLQGLMRRALTISKILFGATMMWWMGRIDDRTPISAWGRFAFQACVAIPLATSNMRLSLFMDQEALQILLTIGWLVFISNAWNFIDNMDGLLPGTAMIAAAGFAAVAMTSGQLFVAAFALALTGALAGVLPHNRRPAKVYMGDEGSMFVGFLLGSLAMVASYRSPTHSGTYLPFLVPLLILIVPTIDALVAITGRLWRRVSPFTAGRDHLSHRLVKRGFSPRATVRILHGLGAAGAALGLSFYATKPLGLGLCLGFGLLAGARLALGFWKPQCD